MVLASVRPVLVWTMRRIYLASRYANKEWMQDVRAFLEDQGHKVISTWMDCEVTVQQDAARSEPAEQASYALRDLAELAECDTLVLVDPESMRGGCYVEQGYAMASGLDVVVVGRRTNCFSFLCRHAPDPESLVVMLDEPLKPLDLAS